MTDIDSERTTGTDEPPDPLRRGEWRTLTVVGLVGLIVALTALQLANGLVIAPALVFSVVFLGLAVALVATGRRWILVATAVVCLLLVIGNLPFLIEDLSHPESAAGFVPSLAALILALATGAAALLARSPVRRGGGQVVVAVVAVVLVAGAGASLLVSLGEGDDTREPGDVTVVAEDFEYPSEVTGEAGTVSLFLDNEDLIHHSFLIEGTDVDVDLAGAHDRRVEVDLDPGEYRYYCDLAGHEDMQGTIVVE